MKPAADSCINPELGHKLHEYELSQLSDVERDRFEEHLMSCSFCLHEAQAMRPIASVASAHREQLLSLLSADGLTFRRLRNELVADGQPEGHGFFGWLQTWPGRASLAGALATVVLLVFLLQPKTSPYTGDLSFELPPYQTGMVMRGEPEDEAARLFESAMQFYNSGQYGLASDGIKHSLQLDAEQPERWLYLGVTQFAQRDAKGAIKSLKLAERGGDGLTKERARWYLAQSYLLAGNAKAANPLLRLVAADNGEHADDARTLLTRIASRD